MRSIQRTLLAWILGALTLGAILIAFVTYLATLDEMHEVFDADLKNIAEAVAAYHRAGYRPDAIDRIELPERNDAPDEYEIVTLTWTPEGRRVFASDPRVQLAFTRVEGWSRPTVGGEPWTVYTRVGANGVAQAAQRMSARQQMAGESAAQVLLPMAALVLVVVGLLVFGLRRGLKPLDAAAQDVARRSARSLDPIRLDDAPQEISPLVQSINGLIERLALALSVQRRFLADAAHELRTPVTALRLQLQLLERSRDESERRQALSDLGEGIQRSQHLIEQLLQVARAEPEAEPTRRERLDLAEIVRSVVATLSLKADHLDLDLGADAPSPVPVAGHADSLTTLLENLVDNALRYTPAGGVVDVTARVRNGRPVLVVADDGPGIAATERERVFDRFYRGEAAAQQARDHSGSGLGLAIVKAIADSHGARVELKDPPSGHGLVVEVSFPPVDARPDGARQPG